MADQFSKMYDVEVVGGDQRQRLAEMLRANALNAPQGQMVSGWYVPPSWSQNLAQLANTAVGVFGGQAIEEWTCFEVLSYISKHMELPSHYNLKHSSLDCFDCTAYQKVTKDVSLWRANNHPELHKQYLVRKEKLDSAIREALEI